MDSEDEGSVADALTKSLGGDVLTLRLCAAVADKLAVSSLGIPYLISWKLPIG